MKQRRLIYILGLILCLGIINVQAGQEDTIGHDKAAIEVVDHDNNDDHDGHDGHEHESHVDHGNECGGHHEFNAGETAVHHISDANVFSIGPWSLPLPCIVYVKKEGLKTFSSSRHGIGHHGDGHYAVDGFVLHGGSLNRIKDFGATGLSTDKLTVDCFTHSVREVNGKDKDIFFAKIDGEAYEVEPKSTLDGGLLGGGITSFFDFSLTKNVVSMIIVFFFLAWMFFSIKKAYVKREGSAPKGIQSVVEPIFSFIEEEVTKPILGDKWERYAPFLMSLFFFILGLNLFGQIPFFGNANVTGNIAVTMALAVFTFIVVNFSGNKNYWEHIVWMPGVPAFVKVILTPVEILGVFLKPFTLFIRLFGNISAGHLVITIFISMIFIFGKSGESFGGSMAGMTMAIPLTMFMMAIELLVAFLQAFVFTILTAVYISAAIEEAHH